MTGQVYLRIELKDYPALGRSDDQRFTSTFVPHVETSIAIDDKGLRIDGVLYCSRQRMGRLEIEAL